jgi:chemotaxis protein CheX
VRYVNPFIRATAHTVETLTGLPIARNDLFVKRDYRMFGDISGVMGLTGTANGAVVLSFPEDVAVRLVGKMINRELKHGIDHVVRDGVGEFVNVIAGNAKAALANTPYHFNITLPSVVAGTGHLITHRTGTPCVVVVFDIGGGEAALQVCLAPGNGD